MPRSDRTAGRWADDGGREARAVALLGTADPAGARTADDRGRRTSGAERSDGGAALCAGEANDDHDRAEHRRQRRPVPRAPRRRGRRAAEGHQPRARLDGGVEPDLEVLKQVTGRRAQVSVVLRLAILNLGGVWLWRRSYKNSRRAWSR